MLLTVLSSSILTPITPSTHLLPGQDYWMFEYEGHWMVEYEGHWMVEYQGHWMLQDNLNKIMKQHIAYCAVKF